MLFRTKRQLSKTFPTTRRIFENDFVRRQFSLLNSSIAYWRSRISYNYLGRTYIGIDNMVRILLILNEFHTVKN